MAYSAAAMWGGAAFVGLVEEAVPGGSQITLLPSLLALAVVAVLVTVGSRLPVAALASMPILGTAMIAAALADTQPAGDGAALYVWPVLWMSYFFGLRGAAGIVAWVGVCHAVGLVTLDVTFGQAFDRWLDVMVSMAVAAAVVERLATRNQRLLAKLAEEAREDALTGLLNRRGFEERASVEVALAARNSTPLAIVSLDIDHFKLVNDEWGHDAGDRVLARLGDVFRAESRSGDLVARMGGEEFVALLVDAELAAATDYAERVRAASVADSPEGLPRVTLSAGVASAVAPPTLEPLIQQADSRLYAAKRAGRDRVVINADRSSALA
jgi:diguanylate cyclase (GGDEF)-like protein